MKSQILFWLFAESAQNEKTEDKCEQRLWYQGGCKNYRHTDLDRNTEMDCKTDCNFGEIGRDSLINFKWIAQTKKLYQALITVQNRDLGYPEPADRYIGMLRFDRKFCPNQILKDITKNRNILLDVGDVSAANHWLESLTYVRNIGEKWEKSAMFAQFRRGLPEPNEMVSNNGRRDQLYVFFHVVNPNYLEYHGFTADTVKECLQKVHLSVMPDDGQAPFSNDYTRCATYKRYEVPVDWSEDDFKPTTTPTTTTTTTTTTTLSFDIPTDKIDKTLKHCTDCDPGTTFDSETNTCVDIDECADGTHSCTGEQVCVNINGGYQCQSENGDCMMYWVSVDFPYADIASREEESVNSCMEWCLQLETCNVFAWMRQGATHLDKGYCWLKGRAIELRYMNDARISGFKCNYQPPKQLLPNRDADGFYPYPTSPVGRVFGGEPIGMSDWPHLVRLTFDRQLWAGSGGPDYLKTFSYGTIVAKHWVLTVSHVCHYFTGSGNGNEVKASFGKGVNIKRRLTHKSNLFIHPEYYYTHYNDAEYGQPAKRYDYCLIYFPEDLLNLENSEGVKVNERTCLSSDLNSTYAVEDLNGRACWTVGHGLQSIGVNIMSQEYCAQHSKDRFFATAWPGNICAGLPDLDGNGLTDGDKGNCHLAMYDYDQVYDSPYWDWRWNSGGDGGAPLVCAIEGKAVTVGIFSIPDNVCMEEGWPGYYASTHYALPWIKQCIAGPSSCLSAW